jgi:OmpA-OmpF porin, OOP family
MEMNMKNIVSKTTLLANSNALSLRVALSLCTAVMSLAACAPPPLPPAPPPPAPVVAAPEPAPPEGPEPTPAEPPKPEPLKLPGSVVFAPGSDRLSPESEPALTQVAEYMAQQKEVTLLRVEGHTDNVGFKTKNQKLSEARALSVAAWLVSKGVDCKRIMPVGFGDTRPVVENVDEDARAQNRRTVFINAVVDGKPVGGSADGGGNVAGDPCKR